MKTGSQSKNFSRQKGTATGRAVSLPGARWSKYVLGSAATALGGIGPSVTPVEAEIHYSGSIRQTVYATFSRSTQHAAFALSGGASLNFIHGLDSHLEGAAFIDVIHVDSRAFRGTGYPSKLHPESNVSAGPFFSGSGNVTFAFHDDRNNPWTRRGPGFAGFKFDVGNGAQYGWVRLRMVGAPENGFKVIDYAWADPGESISTGQTNSSGAQADAVPQSGSLALLALGAIGLKAWRGRRAEAGVR